MKNLPMLKLIKALIIPIVFDHHCSLSHLDTDLFFLTIVSNESKFVLIEDDEIMFHEPFKYKIMYFNPIYKKKN